MPAGLLNFYGKLLHLIQSEFPKRVITVRQEDGNSPNAHSAPFPTQLSGSSSRIEAG